MGTIALWRTVGIASLLSACLLLFGFGYALHTLLNPQPPAQLQASLPTPQLVPEDVEYRIVALGDSLTKGTGDSTGAGYVKRAISLIEGRTGKDVKLLNNLAIGGLRTDQLQERLASDEGYAFAVKQANLIFLSIGGNDLFQLARSGSEAGSLDIHMADTGSKAGLEQLERILNRIRELNREARIVYIGLYNPFYDLPELREGSLTVSHWNTEAYRLLQKHSPATLIPTSDLFELTIASHLARDHFHPNDAGYSRIAERIAQTVE